MNYKYPRAVYRDPQGGLRSIEREELNNPLVVGLARSVRLYDETQEYRLYPRVRESAPHFFCRTKNPRRLVSSIETDPRHNLRRDKLLDRLVTLRDLKVGYREYFGSDQFEFVEIAEIENYSWDKEITRITPHGLRVRHDLFGASSLLSMSERRPWIAIEVIATHYMDEGTFQSLLDLSAEMPLLVAFDLVEAPNYFLALDEAAMTLRLVYYIYDGRVWRNQHATEIETAAALRAVLESDLRDRRRRRAA